jgi:hypothetical protein
MRSAILAAALALLLLCTAVSAGEVRLVPSLPTNAPAAARLYPANRDPLLAVPLAKLPIGAIAPRGWLRHMLDLEAAGMCGRLPEVSTWCKFEGNAWTDPNGQGRNGWEEVPYWLKGYGDLGYVLKDQRIINDVKRWIDAIIAAQEPDGWFGPRGLKTSLEGGKTDFWPHMPILNVMQSWYEYSGDERVIPFMTKYFRYQLNFPEKDFIAGYWPKMRTGDNIESIYWLYNRTGEKWLLDVAKKVHEHGADWVSGVPNWHGVNLTEGFREPATYFLQTHDPKHLKATENVYDTVMGTYGQFPGGGFVADENARPGHTDPRGGFETCSIVEFMHSFELLMRFTGDAKWADRCEEVAFNLLPASMTADEKALHYLTCANQVQLDKNNKAPGIENKGTMFSYSPYGVYRCCQHNHGMGWPYFAEEMWAATADNGLCATLYAPSEVTAKVGDGAEVKIVENTIYPFRGSVEFTIHLASAVRFPLYLRLPRWATNGGRVSVIAARGGAGANLDLQPGGAASGYAVIDRTWADGDRVSLVLIEAVNVRTWAKSHNAVSIERGPLIYSLMIPETYRRYGGSDAWPEYEVYPSTAWNYGLVSVDPVAFLVAVTAAPNEPIPPPMKSAVETRPGPFPEQPFISNATPVTIRIQARRIPAWGVDANHMIAPLQDSPIKSNEPVETVTLIPMGAARLRITMFPVIGSGPDAHEWKPLPKLPTASHCFESDTTAALNDGILPKSSGDPSIPRFTWWDHRGTEEWVQYDFEKPRKLSGVEVYWFDDTGKGQCRVPESWKVMVKSGDGWKDVSGASAYGVEKDKFNATTFNDVETTAVRLVVKLRPNVSGGILEWRVK